MLFRGYSNVQGCHSKDLENPFLELGTWYYIEKLFFGTNWLLINYLPMEKSSTFNKHSVKSLGRAFEIIDLCPSETQLVSFKFFCMDKFYYSYYSLFRFLASGDASRFQGGSPWSEKSRNFRYEMVNLMMDALSSWDVMADGNGNIFASS